MSDGQRVADETRDAVKAVGNASESLRKDINSYADNLLGGNKPHQSTGVHPDAKRTGDVLAKGVGAATAKVEDSINKSTK